MKRRRIAGAMIGLIIGLFCWILLGFMGLPELLIYLSGIWIIEPILQYFDLLGEIILLIPALFISIISFTLYGYLIGTVADLYLKNK